MHQILFLYLLQRADFADSVLQGDAVAAVRHGYQFGTKRGGDELRRRCLGVHLLLDQSVKINMVIREILVMNYDQKYVKLYLSSHKKLKIAQKCATNKCKKITHLTIHNHSPRHTSTVVGIQGLIDLIEEIKRRRVASLDGEDQCQGHQGLLATGELRHLVLLACSAERHAHLHALEGRDRQTWWERRE